LQPSKGRIHDANPIWSNAVSNERSKLFYVVLVRVLGLALQCVTLSVRIDVVQHDVVPNR
jgi:hypothetical protein